MRALWLLILASLLCACGGHVDSGTGDAAGDQLEQGVGAPTGSQCSINSGDLNGPESCASGFCDVDIGCGGLDPLPCAQIGDVCSRPGEPLMLCVASPAGYGRCR